MTRQPSPHLSPLLLLILHALTMPLSEQSIVPTLGTLISNPPTKAAVVPADPIKDLLQLTDDPYKDSVVFVRSPDEFKVSIIFRTLHQ
ncbi:hypothetical protein PRIPAC_88455 [Pristionchus pacificus]|uniref:Uncharacterized protein n=1 Tax=Pristionchus pacificus TaxID=54126 RepID=A0A2A6CZ56_PRIPA|nr:hypothetical protein PRIPAC_88455 [Pristionchus pacificus]|eukprot:PDM83439.1 hypothetical protein PRIPAC_35071 [Pristionchus pacificus]